MSWLFENPRNILGAERAVVSLLAGDVYDRPTIRARLLVFKALYSIVAALYRVAPGLLIRARAPGNPTSGTTREGA